MSIIDAELIHPLQYKIRYSVGAERSKEIYNQVLSAINQSGNYGQSLAGLDEKKMERIFQQAVVENDINIALQQAKMELEKIKPKAKLASLNVDAKSFKYVNGEVEFSLQLDLLPEISLENLDKVILPANLNMNLPNFETYANEQKKQILLRLSPIVETFAKSQLGSILNLDIKIWVNDQLEQGLSGKEQIVIGFNQVPIQLEEKLLGLQTGDKTNFELTLPSSHPISNLQNKLVRYEIEVLTINQLKYTSLSDFYNSLDSYLLRGIAESLDSLQKLIEKNYLDMQASSYKKAMLEEISKQLLVQIPEFELPNELLQNNYNQTLLAIQNVSQANNISAFQAAKNLGLPIDGERDLEQQISSFIIRQIRLNYILQAILQEKTEIIKPSDSQIRNLAVSILQNPAQFGLPAQVDENQAKSQAQNLLTKEAILLYFLGKR